MATLALQAGVHPKIVQDQLGHADVHITLDTYSRVTAAHTAALAAQPTASAPCSLLTFDPAPERLSPGDHPGRRA